MKTFGTAVLLLGSLAAASEPGGRPATTPDKVGPKSAEAKGPDKKTAPAEKKRKPKFTIGKETTYATGPLDEDGYIDYAAALNERLGKGVTPANNAYVLLWKALGPHPEGATMPAEFFKWLGVEAPPERGEYFIPLFSYLKEHLKVDPQKEAETISNELQQCIERPWTAKQHPNIAGWLKANEKPLAVAIEATKRSHYFSPLVPTRSAKGSSGLIGALLPAVQKCRELASALTARAMLHVGEGRPDDAWRDLLACHRLGRHVAHGGTLIEGLVGIAIDTIAGKSDLAFLDAAGLDSRRTLACLGDLQKLPPMPRMADKVDLGERFMFLDCIKLVDQGGIRSLEPLAGGGESGFPDAISKLFMRTIDWNPALRNGNRWYDRMAKALRAPDRATREKKLEQIETALKALRVKATESVQNPLKILLAKDTGKELGETIGNIMISLLVPAIHKVQNAADRTEQIQNNLHLAFALAAYRRDHEGYPRELKALAPKYLTTIPQDMFSGEALIYRPVEKGYLLYSVGVNGVDEQGRGFDDDPKGDDLTVRMPLPKPKPPQK